MKAEEFARRSPMIKSKAPSSWKELLHAIWMGFDKKAVLEKSAVRLALTVAEKLQVKRLVAKN